MVIDKSVRTECAAECTHFVEGREVTNHVPQQENSRYPIYHSHLHYPGRSSIVSAQPSVLRRRHEK